QPAKRRAGNRVGDFRVRASALVVRRRHSQSLPSPFIKAAARPVTGIEDCRGDIRTIAQPAFHFFQTQRVGKLPRRQADDALEISLEVIWTASDATGERGERQVAFDVRKVHARTTDLVGPRIDERSCFRLAALAGAKPFTFGVRRRVKKLYARSRG